jgi:hypothetical protein
MLNAIKGQQNSDLEEVALDPPEEKTCAQQFAFAS